MIRRLALGLAAATLGTFLALPVATLVARALGGGAFAAAVGSPAVLGALSLSLATTAVSLAIIVLFGTPLAFILARRRFRGSGLVDVVVTLPLVLPPSVAGLALLLVLGRRGLLGEWLGAAGLSIPFTAIAVVLAQVFVAAPFYVRAARAGIASLPRELEDAARVDGGTELAVFRHVMVPLAAPALGAGLALSWARSLGEFGATILFAGNVAGRTQTLPLVVYAEFGAGDLDAAIAAATVLVLAAVAVLVGVRLGHGGPARDVASTS